MLRWVAIGVLHASRYFQELHTGGSNAQLAPLSKLTVGVLASASDSVNHHNTFSVVYQVDDAPRADANPV